MAYNLSFTGAYLLLHESLLVAELYQEKQDWDHVKEQVFADNLLQTKTRATAEKRWRVLTGRLQTLSPAQFRLLVEGDTQSQRWLLLLAIAKYHRLIREFLVEVIRRKYLLFEYEVLESDYRLFFKEKQALYKQLSTITETTQKKIRAVTFNILQECGILSAEAPRQIFQPFLNDTLIQAVVKEDATLLSVYLYADADILAYQEKYAVDPT